MPCQIIFTSVLPGMRGEQGTAFIFAGPFFDVFFVSSDCALRCTYLYTVYGDTDIGICDKRENTWYAYAHGVSVRSPGGHRHKLGGKERAPHRLGHRFLNLRETDRKRKADFAERVTDKDEAFFPESLKRRNSGFSGNCRFLYGIAGTRDILSDKICDRNILRRMRDDKGMESPSFSWGFQAGILLPSAVFTARGISGFVPVQKRYKPESL